MYPVNNHYQDNLYHDNIAIWTEKLLSGHHWSGRIQKGTILQFESLASHANISLYCVNAQEKLERFNMPDSLKAQHTAFLSTGHVLYSDFGRVMASIVKDDHGWNDVLCGASNRKQIEAKFGKKRFQDARNQMYRNGLDSLLVEMAKYGLSLADLTATVNLFSKVIPDESGQLSYITNDNKQQLIELRFEMDCLVFLSNSPHPLDNLEHYSPASIQMRLYQAKPLQDIDICRDSCPQNQRGFQNNARYHAV